MQPLFVHRFLLRASLAAGNLFAWVFLFHAFFVLGASGAEAFGLVVCLYALVHTIGFLLTPVAGRSLRQGVRQTLVYATMAQACAFLSLALGLVGSIGVISVPLWWGITGFALFSGLYRTSYFVPYAIEQDETPVGSRPIFEIFLALVPAAAGVVIISSDAGPQALLFGLGALALLALLPLASVRQIFEPFNWSYGDTVQALFHPRYHALVFHSFLNGIQGAGLLLFWPLAAFLLLGAQYQLLGAVVSLTFLLIIAVRLITASTRKKVRSPHITTTILFSSWIVRFAAFSPVTIMIADVLYHSGVPAKRFGMDVFGFEQAADGSHYIDELTALKEMGLALGRIFAAVLVGSLVVSGSLQIMLLAGLALAMIASVISLLARPSRVVA